MHILLPPSETKRDGGEGAGLRLGALSFPSLTEPRTAVLNALDAASDEALLAAMKAGSNGPRELARNRALRTAPLLPAVDRYTGVLYDALDAPSLSRAGRSYLGASVLVHSALFGLVGALDPIPAYRLSASSRLPGLRLATLWRDRVSAELADLEGLLLDLRSDTYADLGPMPDTERVVRVRIVEATDDGSTRALNHFNKTAKGHLVRLLAEDRPRFESVGGLLRWAERRGLALSRAEPGVLELVAARSGVETLERSCETGHDSVA